MLTDTLSNLLESGFTIGAASTAAGSGSITWNYQIADGATDFLRAGESIVLTFTVQVSDGKNGFASQDVVITLNGTDDGIPVIDGYIANALVFRDVDEDGVLDVGEAFTFTDATGIFNGLDGLGRIVVAPRLDVDGKSISYDLSTGDPFTGMLTAPVGSNVVTPLTTLIDALLGRLVQPGTQPTPEQVAQVNAQLVAALGRPTGTSLTNLDPIQAIADASSTRRRSQWRSRCRKRPCRSRTSSRWSAAR
jgi:VCBS repeat-containing protein